MDFIEYNVNQNQIDTENDDCDYQEDRDIPIFRSEFSLNIISLNISNILCAQFIDYNDID